MKPVAFFIGIGGIGMSALARYFHASGTSVAGYDRTPSALTNALQAEGIAVGFTDTVEDLPTSVRHTPIGEVEVIYTPAIPTNSPQLNWFRDKGYSVRKRAAVLAEIANQGTCLAVAGTHGKTTTSTLLAYLLDSHGPGCTAFLGGIASNYHSNAILNPESPFVVAEADEYDRSFLQLHPNCAILTSMDPDHLDIYGDSTAMNLGFGEFMGQVSGLKLVHHDTAKALKTVYKGDFLTYDTAPESKAVYTATDLHIKDGAQHFGLKTPDGLVGGLRLPMPGIHNLANAVAACALALHNGMSADQLKAALPGFKGIQRRFAYALRTPVVIIDDYAHHPTEIRAAVEAARQMHPEKQITGLFQPHLYTRTRDFVDGFAESLSLLDTAFVLPIYAARENPLPGVDSQCILDKMSKGAVSLVDKSNYLDRLRESAPEVLLVLGAGDIDRLVDPLVKSFSS